ncbi:response regulator [Pinibacter soli]|uniref:Response regulator n=1 Tax=Pinibacter soli TaxID=3044211 RepID=A0ABT6RJP3_9BACT|nr:response regulator [Pinibacter soli]MDI3322635.1 response regulator [Pinibacter soli]
MEKLFVLIAEDDADDRFLLQNAFEEMGYTDKLEFVENGVELMDFLQNNSNNSNSVPGFILLDLNMPKKDGREVLKELKQHEDYKTIPVVVFSTTKNETEVKRCYELGANTYVVKPVSYDSLLKFVENIRSYWFNVATIPM